MADSVGERIRELRTWRDMTLRATAELAGISPAYLSMIESGDRQLQRRSRLEAIARALRVSPADLGAVPVLGVVDPDVGRARGALPAVERVLAELVLGEGSAQPRPWPAVLAELERLRTVLKPKADVAGQMEAYPQLVNDLHSWWVTEPSANILKHMVWLYLDISNSAGSLGANGTAALAVMHMRAAADELNDPLWSCLATYGRCLGLGAAGSRQRAHELAVSSLDLVDPLESDDHRQVAGSLHLSAALSSAALADTDRAATHLGEARVLADHGADPSGTGFGGLCFSRSNVSIWSTSLAIEAGDFGTALEVARDARVEEHPSWSRQGAYYGDLARALATDRRRRTEAVQAMSRAEALAPVRTRSNVWLRETTLDLLRQVDRDTSAGRELRGIAYRMGMAS